MESNGTVYPLFKGGREDMVVSEPKKSHGRWSTGKVTLYLVVGQCLVPLFFPWGRYCKRKKSAHLWTMLMIAIADTDTAPCDDVHPRG